MTPRNTIIGITIGAIALGGAYFGAQKSPEEKLKDEQAAYVREHGKYKRTSPNLKKGCVINEYVSPRGPGYQIICTDKDGVRAEGFGPEAKERTYLIPTVASTTQ